MHIASVWLEEYRGDIVVLNKAVPAIIKLILLAISTAIIVFLGILNLRDRIQWTYTTDGVFWKESSNSLKADHIETNGPGNRAGIALGDRLISVNGYEINNLGKYADFISEMLPGTVASYKVDRASGEKGVSIQLEARSQFSSKDWLRTFLAFLCLGIGIFVVIRGEKHPRIIHFYLICLASFVVFLFSYTTKLSHLDWTIYWLSVLGFLILPALFMHLCLKFPAEHKVRRHAFLLYIPAIMSFFIHFLILMGQLAPVGLPRTARSIAIIENVELMLFLGGFVFGGILLFNRRLTTQDLIERQQLKWVSYGALAGIVPFGLIYGLPALLGVHATLAMESSMVSLGIIPLSMGYALIKFRLMDVEIIARRSAAYAIASSALLAVYILFALVLGRFFQSIAPQADFIGICAAVLAIAFIFSPLRNAVQDKLDRIFYKERFEDRAAFLEFARSLASEISLGQLAKIISEKIAKTFQVDTAAVFLADPIHKGFFKPEFCSNPQIIDTGRLYREDELSENGESRYIAELQGGADYLHQAGAVLRAKGMHYLQDLRSHGAHIGVIALGRLPKGGHFTTEDLNLISALAHYAAIALENASLYKSVEEKALELERMKAYAENILESINVAVIALDFEGRIESCNQAFEELYNVSRDQIIGTLIETLFQKDVIVSIQRVAGTMNWEFASRANIFKLYLGNRGNKRIIVNLSLIPMQNCFGGNSGSLIVLDDVSDKIQMEDQLMQAEKLSSIGLLVAGIAHEVNTPIAGISSYTQMLLKDTPESDKRKTILEKIERQTFRAAEIVNGLLSFSRMSGSEFTDLSVTQLIHDSLALIEHQLRSCGITIESEYDNALPHIFGNAGKLQQVFLNLFMNAKDAMPSGGVLAIKTAMSDSMVVIDVSDTGMGIPEENIKKIFDPFFTTKAIGKGTGLGLAVSYGIIQEHYGRIFVNSNSEKGTHFRIKLPTRLN